MKIKNWGDDSQKLKNIQCLKCNNEDMILFEIKEAGLKSFGISSILNIIYSRNSFHAFYHCKKCNFVSSYSVIDTDFLD